MLNILLVDPVNADGAPVSGRSDGIDFYAKKLPQLSTQSKYLQ